VPKTWHTTKAISGGTGIGPGNGITTTTLKVADPDYLKEAASYAQTVAKRGWTPAVKSVPLDAGNAKLVAATVKNKNGTTTTDLLYFIEGDGATYVLVFQAPPKLYKANLSLFGKIAATAKVG